MDTANPMAGTRNYAMWIACSRKKPYHSVKAAKDAAARIRRRSNVKLEPYTCPHCGETHLATAQTKRSGKG